MEWLNHIIFLYRKVGIHTKLDVDKIGEHVSQSNGIKHFFPSLSFSSCHWSDLSIIRSSGRSGQETALKEEEACRNKEAARTEKNQLSEGKR